MTIERRRAKLSIPTACRKYGLPVISKRTSDMLQRLNRAGAYTREVEAQLIAGMVLELRQKEREEREKKNKES